MFLIWSESQDWIHVSWGRIMWLADVKTMISFRDLPNDWQLLKKEFLSYNSLII